MASNPQLKYTVVADTSKFAKGTKEAKAALKDLDKTSRSALGSISDAFGVNIPQVQQLTSSFKGLGLQLGSLGSSGSSALGKLATAATSVGGAIGAIGIGAAVTGFKLLTGEAEAFKKTVQGANIELQTAAYISTYQQTLHDLNSSTGKSIAETQSKIKEWWAGLTANVKAWGTAAIGNLLGISDVTQSDVIKGIQDANANAERASEIAGEMYSIERQQAANKVRIAELDAQIAEERDKAVDPTLTATEQLEANARAQELIKQKYGLQIPLAQKLASLQAEMSSLASDDVAAENKKFQLQTEVNNLRASEATELRRLLSQQGTLTTEAEAEAEAVAKVAQSRKELASLDLSVSDSAKNILSTAGATTSVTSGLQGEFVMHPTDEEMDEYQARLEQMRSLAESAFSSIGDTIGGLIGDLATGGDAWGNFGNSALSALADLAGTVGKIAIATGAATLKIGEALTNPLEGGLAIAAGVALVALSAAVKAGLSNVASGNYSSSSASVSSTSSSYSSTNAYDTQRVEVSVTGTLKASGSSLVAVLNETNDRKNYTT